MAADDKDLTVANELKAIYQELHDLTEARLAAEMKVIQATGEQVTHAERVAAAAQAEAAGAHEVLRTVNLTVEQRERELAAIDRAMKDGDHLQGLNADHVKSLKKRHDLLVKINDLDPAKLDELREEYILQEKAAEALKERAKQSDALADRMYNLVGIGNKWQATTEGQVLSFLKQKDGLKLLGNSMKDKLKLDNIAGNAVTKVTEATVALLKEQDSAIANFKKATGAGDAYNDIIIDSHINLRTYGVTTEQAGKATGDLFTHMSGFSRMNKEAQMNLVQTTALLERFGVGSTEAAKSLDFLTKGLKMSSEQAVSTTQNLVGLGQGLDVPPQIIFNQFQQASSQLAAHGGDMVKVFKGMAAAAKASGAEMGTLLGYAGQFDVFSTGATAVGKLNALLGGPYLNTIEMLNASEEERIGLTLKALEASGKQFSDLSKFEQISIANAAGIKDMAEANKLLGMSSSEYEIMQSRAESATLSEEEFKKVTQDAMSVVEKFTTIAKNFAMNLAFLLKPLGWVADQILALQKAMGDWFGVVVLVTGIIVFFTGKILGLGAALSSVLTSGLAAMGKGIEAVGISAGKAGTSATAGALGLLAFGAAVVMVGFGIWLATTGIVNLIDSLGKLTGEQLQAVVPLLMSMTLAFAVLTAALLVVALVGSSAILPLLAMGLAFIMIGTGVMIAAEGMASLGDSMSKNASGIERVLAATMLLVPLIATLGTISLEAGAAMLMLGMGFAALAAGLWLLPTDKLQALADIVKSINEAESAAAAPGGGGGATGSPFGNMIEAVNSLDTAKVLPAILVAGAAHAYNISSKETSKDSMKNSESLLREILEQLKKTPAQTTAMVENVLGDIVIVLNDREVGRARRRTRLDLKRPGVGTNASTEI